MTPLLLAVVALLGMTVACAARAPETRPADMSAAEHRSTARSHAHTATTHARQYDPNAHATGPASYGLSTVRAINSDEPLGASTVAYGDRRYNPTAEHRSLAEQHQEHARQHSAAASAPEASTDVACRRVPHEVRAQCPLAGVAAAETVPEGVRVRLASGTSLSAFVERARCHQAVARERHFQGMTACPLFLPNVEVEVEPSGDGGSVLIRSSDPSIAAAIQERMGPLVDSH